MPATLLALAQRLLDGPWQHAEAAREACRAASWAAFVQHAAPPKPLLLGRRAYNDCIERAVGTLCAPFTTSCVLVPAWACSTYEEEGAQWVATHVQLDGEGRLEVREGGPFLCDSKPCAEQAIECTIRQWTAATVVASEAYGPSVSLQRRVGPYAVLNLTIAQVLTAQLRDGAPLPRPTRVVPVFSTWFEPRVVVPPALDAQIRALSETATEEEP